MIQHLEGSSCLIIGVSNINVTRRLLIGHESITIYELEAVRRVSRGKKQGNILTFYEKGCYNDDRKVERQQRNCSRICG